MLGPAKPRRLDQPIAVSLEDLVPQDHFYRHLEATLDLSFVRDWTRELYAERGRPSIDPVVFFKLQLIMFFEGIRSERQLIETARLKTARPRSTQRQSTRARSLSSSANGRADPSKVYAASAAARRAQDRRYRKF
jgi:transposase